MFFILDFSNEFIGLILNRLYLKGEMFGVKSEQMLSPRAPAFAHAVIDGIIEGEVLSCDSSDSVLIGTKSGIYVVDGDGVSEVLLKVILEKWTLASLKQERFTLFVYTQQWQQAIENCMRNPFRKMERLSYKFDLELYQERELYENAQYEIKPFNRIHISRSEEFHEAYFTEYWDSVDCFLKSGIGFCILDEDILISEVVSIFKSAQYAEMDIATHINYRGKGLAIHIAEHFINTCLESNIEPRWDCDLKNVASMRLAERLGFTKSIMYKVYTRA